MDAVQEGLGWRRAFAAAAAERGVGLGPLTASRAVETRFSCPCGCETAAGWGVRSCGAAPAPAASWKGAWALVLGPACRSGECNSKPVQGLSRFSSKRVGAHSWEGRDLRSRG